MLRSVTPAMQPDAPLPPIAMSTPVVAADPSPAQSRHRRLAAFGIAAASLLMVRCATAPPVREFDEITAAGQSFHTGTPIVRWDDQGGYDAYQTQKRFQTDEPPDGKMRYRKVRANLPAALEASVMARGFTLDELRSVVHVFVLHFDVAGTSRQCFKILQDVRNLSVHFMLDTDGTIYQTLDLQEQAHHATYANCYSIGIEIAHPGCWPRERHPDMLRWYDKDEQGWFMKFPAFLGETGIRTNGFVPRPDRPDVIAGVIHGKTYYQLDFTNQQYGALARLCATLHRLFPRIQLDAPRDPNGAILTTNLAPEQMATFEGIVGHFHVQANKQDPGPAFQWERLLRDARAAR